MNTKSKAKIQNLFRKSLRTALAVLVLLGIMRNRNVFSTL